MTVDIARARAFVEANGSALDRARLYALMDGVVPAAMPDELRALQNDDGGFALGQIAGRPSALSSTAYVLSWLRDLQLTDSSEAQRAVRYIESQQTKRGIWRERPEIQRYQPPPWMDPESVAADIYTTALCTSTLVLLGGDELAADQAISWIQTQQGRDGLLAGFKAHSSWLAVPAFAQLLGQETRATRRLIAGLGEMLADDWSAGMLAWMLQCLIDGGYTRRTRLVERAWEQLGAAQQPDGSFVGDEGDDPFQATLQAIDVAQRIDEED